MPTGQRGHLPGEELWPPPPPCPVVPCTVTFLHHLQLMAGYTCRTGGSHPLRLSSLASILQGPQLLWGAALASPPQPRLWWETALDAAGLPTQTQVRTRGGSFPGRNMILGRNKITDCPFPGALEHPRAVQGEEEAEGCLGRGTQPPAGIFSGRCDAR